MLTFKKAVSEEVGIPGSCIINFIRRLDRHGIPMHSFLILRHDRLIAEGYYAPYHADTLHRMFSISKSFTSIAIALLAEEGRLSLDDAIVSYFPDKVLDDVHPWIASTTIRDMLMMRTCHASSTYKPDMNKDWVGSYFTTPPTHPSGRLFHYDTSASHTLCALVERLTHMPMLDYLKQRLAPLGLSESSYMLTDPFGVSMGGSGLVATPMDLLKFGYLIASHGRLGQQQLVPADYIDTATSCLTDTRVTAPVLSEACGYGYQFWRNEKNGFTCYGMGGQLIICLPDYDMICVTTADTQGIGGGNQMIYDALYEEILPYASEHPLEENPSIQKALQALTSSLQLAPLKGTQFAPTASEFFGIHYQLTDNPMGFTDFSVTFDSDSQCGQLHFTLNGQDCTLPFGIGHLEECDFPIYHQHCASSGIWQDSSTLYIRAHIIDAYVGSVHFQCVFSSQDVTVFMKKQEESLFTEFSGHLYGIPAAIHP